MKVSLSIFVVAFETDFGGVVSNTRYLEYMERGRHELLRASGLKIGEIWKTHGVQPVVRRAQIEYLGFARHEDELVLETRIVSHAGATTLLGHELKRVQDEVVVMRGEQTLAYLNTQWKPVRVPPIFREVLICE